MASGGDQEPVRAVVSISRPPRCPEQGSEIRRLEFQLMIKGGGFGRRFRAPDGFELLGAELPFRQRLWRTPFEALDIPFDEIITARARPFLLTMQRAQFTK